MRILFVMDALSTVIVDEDTSFALMFEAQERGHRVDHCQPQDLTLEGDRCGAKVREAICRRDPAAPITLGEPEDRKSVV